MFGKIQQKDCLWIETDISINTSEKEYSGYINSRRTPPRISKQVNSANTYCIIIVLV